MTTSLLVPDYIKYRREAGFGLVYDHENYGYEDATLSQVRDVVLDVLEYVEETQPTRDGLEAEFSPATVDKIVRMGFLTDA